MQFSTAGIRFAPHLPDGINEVVQRNIPYREALLTVRVTRGKTASCRINGKPCDPFLPADRCGSLNIELSTAS
jgi:hypothetical protein